MRTEIKLSFETKNISKKLHSELHDRFKEEFGFGISKPPPFEGNRALLRLYFHILGDKILTINPDTGNIEAELCVDKLGDVSK